jgi:hypothetical protein
MRVPVAVAGSARRNLISSGSRTAIQMPIIPSLAIMRATVGGSEFPHGQFSRAA